MSIAKWSNIVVVTVIAFVAGCSQSEPQSELQGSFETTKVSENYFLYQDLTDESALNYIQRKNPGRNESITDDKTLAAQVAQVARCFGLDGRIFAGLVAKESSFKMDAVSSTGAVGLTQQTYIGLTEVNDQLGRRGADYARKGATDYFNSAINCAVNGAAWTNLWQRAAGTRGMKNILKIDSNTALIYGAILLKTNLSAAKTNAPKASIEILYREALRRYNGDPAEKENYQIKIMKSAAEEFSL
jgi:hypothetical protein